MTTKEFSKYFIDNIGRATLVNALNVSDKLYNNDYDVKEFIEECIGYISNLQTSCRIPLEKSSKMLVAFYNCNKDLNSEFNYNKLMVLNDLIISIWEINNGH